MPDYIIDQNACSEFLAALAQERELWAPKKVGSRIEMALSRPEEVVWDAPNTHLSPKAAFFPQTEKMMAFHNNPEKLNHDVYQDLFQEAKPRVMLGLRPCDSRGLAISNKVFQNDRFTNPYWKTKYEATTFIGMACPEPCAQCFCSKVGGSPFGVEGLDVLAYLSDGQLALRTLTPKGEELLSGLKAKVGSLKEADLEAAIGQLKTAAEEKITAQMPLSQVAQKEIMELFNAPHWEKTGESCLNCGVCTFVCPTCHCFDIQDETNAEGGLRMRNWDTCMSWLFTMHGTGHNPRPKKTDRVRQRFMHKLKYIPLKQEGSCGCTGCGRCVVHCPVNIDIREVAALMNA